MVGRDWRGRVCKETTTPPSSSFESLDCFVKSDVRFVCIFETEFWESGCCKVEKCYETKERSEEILASQESGVTHITTREHFGNCDTHLLWKKIAVILSMLSRDMLLDKDKNEFMCILTCTYETCKIEMRKRSKLYVIVLSYRSFLRWVYWRGPVCQLWINLWRCRVDTLTPKCPICT